MEMNGYAAMRLRLTDAKQLEGLTPADIVMDTLEKILTGKRSWENSKLNDFKKFMFGCLSSELHHILERLENRGLKKWRIKDYLFGIDNRDEN